MKFLQIAIPKELHRAFKKYCFERDITMTEVITRFIKKILDKVENI